MAELHHPHAPHAGHEATPNPEVRHEESDVDIRAVLGFGGALIVVAFLINLIVFVLFRYFDSREARRVTPQYPLAVAQGIRVPPEPRLQTNPRQDLADLRAKEAETLASYGWVDRNAGIVRIPIDEAIRLTLERGLPERQRTQP
jgi:hypothetical protein